MRREELDEKRTMSLDQVEAGEVVIIQSFDETSSEHKYLISLGVLPGDKLLVTAKAPFGGPISCKHEDETFFALRRSYAKKIFVTSISDSNSH